MMEQAETREAEHALASQARRLQTLHEIDRGILEAESVHEIAVGALARIRDLISCERAAIGLFDRERREATVFAAEVDAVEPDTTGVRYALDDLGDMLDALESRAPFVIDDLAAPSPIPVVLETFRDRGLRSSLQVPLVGENEVLGVVSLMAKRPNAFSRDDVEIATEVADQIAIAIEHQRLRDAEILRSEELHVLVAELRESEAHRAELLRRLVDAHEEERRLVAAAVHDDAIQKMAVVLMRLDMLEMDHPELTGSSVDALRTSVRESIDQLRRLMFELRPYALETDGVAAALRAYLKEQAKLGDAPRYTLNADLHHEPAPEIRAVLFRIAQEALRNARAHARASSVTVLLQEDDDGYRVEVADDGIGFDATGFIESPPGHLGLTAMRERAEMAGGWCRLTSRPGLGTSVEAWIPRLSANAVAG